MIWQVLCSFRNKESTNFCVFKYIRHAHIFINPGEHSLKSGNYPFDEDVMRIFLPSTAQYDRKGAHPGSFERGAQVYL